MTTYNTGNPVGSSDPRDLYDNAENLDRAVNSEGTTFNDRTGKSRLTLKGMEQVFDGGQPAIDAYYNAAEAASLAESDADRAEAARDAAQLSAGVYADTASGLAATAEGDYFSVPSADNDAFLILYRHDPSPVATEVKRYPSVQGARLVANILGGDIEAIGDSSPITSWTTPSSDYVNTYIDPTSEEGYLGSVYFHVSLTSTPAYASIFVFEPLGGDDFSVKYHQRVEITDGYNNFSAPEDIPLFYLKKGSRVGVSVSEGAYNISSTVETTPAETRPFLMGEVKLGATVTIVQADGPRLRRPSLSYTLVHSDKVLKGADLQMELLASGSLVSRGEYVSRNRGKLSLKRDRFTGTTAPTGWAAGAWTVNDGLVAPSSPSNSTYAALDDSTNANYCVTHATWIVNDASTSKFGIYFPGNGLCEIDAAESVMRRTTGSFTELDDFGGGAVSIPPLVAGREYSLTARREGHDITLIWLDPVENQETRLDYPFVASSYGGLYGRPGVLYRAGAAQGVTCTGFEHSALFDNPRVIVFGDSNANGIASVGSYQTALPKSWRDSWVYLLDRYRSKGDVLNSSLGGLRATDTLDQINLDLDPFSPDFVVIALGSNDSDQQTWRTAMVALLDAARSRGAVPVVCTIPPREGRQAFINSANSDILGGYFGSDVRVIDIAKAVTVGGDRETYNPQYFKANDTVHLNLAGHRVVFGRLKHDAPYLLHD